MNKNNYNSLDGASLNTEIDRLQLEIDVNNNALSNSISKMNIRNAESLNLNFESAKAMGDLRNIQQEDMPYEDKKQRILEKFKLVKELKDKSKEVHNKYIELDKKNNMLTGKNHILNEQLRRATIKLVVRTYSDSEISNVAKTITKF